jgi:hypothetical protein
MDKQAEDIVLVIHGVGDPEPGETLSLFARSLASYGTPLVENPQVLWLTERSLSGTQVGTFASHIREARIGERRVDLAEVYWGDLSFVRKGILGALAGLVDVLFGLRYIAFVAANQKGAAAKSLRQLGVWCTSMVHGPILALTGYLAWLVVVLTAHRVNWPTAQGEFWTTAILAFAIGVAMVVANIGYQLARVYESKQFWFWFQAVTFFAAGLACLKPYLIDPYFPDAVFEGNVDQELTWHCGVLVTMLGVLWSTQMLLVLGLGLAWLVARFSADTHRTGLNVALLLPALAVGFWGLALPMIWVTAAKTLERLLDLSEFNSLFMQAIPILGVQVVMALIVVGAAAIVILNYARWRMLRVKQKLQEDAAPPRLIVHPALQFVMGCALILGVFSAARVGFWQFLGYSYDEIWGGRLMAEANHAVNLLLPAGVIVMMAFKHLRPILDIVLDVMNHFFYRPTRFEDAVDGDEFSIEGDTICDGTLYFVRRDAVHVRVKKTLAYFRDRCTTRPRLTIVSHSQGTMIAIETLNDPSLAWLNTTFSSVRLVTMGSPFSHLYQHYFAHIYPPLADEQWRPLVSRVDRWINIYRRDDFVGTQINFPDDADAQKYSNHAVGLRGHLFYWADRDVLEILQRELFPSTRQETPFLRRAA